MNKQKIQQYEYDDSVSQVQSIMANSGVIRTCANCEHVNLEQNICGKYKQTPPITVISTGCPAWELDIPF